MPAVEALWSYGETGYHSLAAAVVRQRYGREAMASAFRILGEGQLSLTKFLLVLDRPMDLQDFPAVLEHCSPARIPRRSVRVLQSVHGHARLHGTAGERGDRKGVWLGLGDRCGSCRAAFRARAPAGVRDREVFCPGCLVVGRTIAAEPEPPRASPQHPRCANGRWWCSSTTRGPPPGACPGSCGPRSRASSPRRTSTPGGARRSCGTISPTRRRWSSTPG